MEWMKGIEVAWAVLKWVGVLLVFATVTGCSAQNGWRFEIGVSPVNNLKNEAGFGGARGNRQTTNDESADERKY